MTQTDKGDMMWQQHGIEVLSARDTWHAQSHQIAVKRSQIVKASASCIPAPAERGKCEVEPLAPMILWRHQALRADELRRQGAQNTTTEDKIIIINGSSQLEIKE